MADAPATYILLDRRVAELRRRWLPWRHTRDAILFERARTVIDERISEVGEAKREAREEGDRAAEAERFFHVAREACGFERNGFDKLASVHDCLGTVKDLLKALDLIGDGIGWDVDFAASAVANEAAMTASCALDEAGSMIEMRKVVTP